MSAPDARTDGQLLHATRHGDGSAFGVFYRRHLPAVLRRLLAQTGEPVTVPTSTGGDTRASARAVAAVIARGPLGVALAPR